MTDDPRASWRTIVLVIAAVAAVVCAAAAVDTVRTGLGRPGLVLAGVVVTALVNRVYVVIHRHGKVVEGIDVSELSIVGLALLLPPAQAVLAFTLGNLIVELPTDRAPVKKAFNVGVRTVGAGLLVLPVLLVGGSGVSGTRVAVVVVGALLYAVASALCTAAVLSRVQETAVRSLLLPGLPSRALVWAESVAVGASVAIAVETEPAALIGVGALLLLLHMTADVARRSQFDVERLHGVLAATAAIQSAGGTEAQDAALLSCARDLLPWREVLIRCSPPQGNEVGHPLPSEDDAPRWLLARPRPGSDPWTADDARVLETLAASAAVTIELAQLQAHVAEQALLDPLTGLGNRRRLDRELHRLCAAPEPVSVLVLDLNGFKAINDRLGHEVGDAVLEQVAERLREHRRDDDVVVRLGGDEFVILLPGVGDPDLAREVGQRVAEEVARPLQVGIWRLRVGTSIGVAVSGLDGGSPAALLRRADQRMYDDKRDAAGGSRDLVVVSPTGNRRGVTPVEPAVEGLLPRPR